MDITSAKLALNFSARSRSTQQGLSATANIGDLINLEFEDADLAYACKITSAAVSDVATLTHSTGIVAQTTGTPVILDGDGNDWEGITLPAATTSLIYLVVIIAGAANTGTVAAVGADLAESPSGTLRAAGLVLLSQPAATAVGSSSTLTLTFSAAGDSAEVYVFAKSV
jgi:hypothetical protein